MLRKHKNVFKNVTIAQLEIKGNKAFSMRY